MKIKFFILAAAIFSTHVFANEPQVINEYQVPFYNVDIYPNTKIHASYSFDPNHQTLVCMTSNLDVLSIEWPCKGAQCSTSLSPGNHTSFKGNPFPKGYFAEPKGHITIAYFQKPVSSYATVSCEYHTWH